MGETEQHLKKRLASHRFDLNHVDKDSTALAAHKKHTGHEIDLSNVSVIAYESNFMRRKLREVVEIIRDKYTINFKSDSDDLHSFYAHVLVDD